MDNFFKMGILLLGVVFTFLYFQNMDNNRYTWSQGVVFDTKTGILYKVKEVHADFMPVWDSSKGAVKEE